MNIQDFKGSFENLAKPTLFKVGGFGTDRQFEFMCKASSIPGAQIGIIEVPYMGRKIKIPGDRTYEEWTITVLNDETYNVRKYFEDWAQRINHEETNIGTPSVEAIKEDGYIQQLSQSDKVIAEYKIIGAFPTLVSPIEVSWESNDTVSEFTVSLNYDFFQRV